MSPRNDRTVDNQSWSAYSTTVAYVYPVPHKIESLEKDGDNCVFAIYCPSRNHDSSTILKCMKMGEGKSNEMKTMKMTIADDDGLRYVDGL